MPAYGYEFYLLVVNSISHSFAALTREISSWPLEDKIHIHARACNILYIFCKGALCGHKSRQRGTTTLRRKKIALDSSDKPWWPDRRDLRKRSCVRINKLTSVFLCVCPVIDHEFRHHIVKVAVDPRGDSRVDPQTTLAMLWRNSWSITGQTH